MLRQQVTLIWCHDSFSSDNNPTHVATITSLTRPLLVARAASFQASIQEHTTNSHNKSKEENSCTTAQLCGYQVKRREQLHSCVVIRSAICPYSKASDQLTNGGSTNNYQTLELNLVLKYMENYLSSITNQPNWHSTCSCNLKQETKYVQPRPNRYFHLAEKKLQENQCTPRTLSKRV